MLEAAAEVAATRRCGWGEMWDTMGRRKEGRSSAAHGGEGRTRRPVRRRGKIGKACVASSVGQGRCPRLCASQPRGAVRCRPCRGVVVGQHGRTHTSGSTALSTSQGSVLCPRRASAWCCAGAAAASHLEVRHGALRGAARSAAALPRARLPGGASPARARLAGHDGGLDASCQMVPARLPIRRWEGRSSRGEAVNFALTTIFLET